MLQTAKAAKHVRALKCSLSAMRLLSNPGGGSTENQRARQNAKSLSLQNREEFRQLSYETFLHERVPLFVPTATLTEGPSSFRLSAALTAYQFLYDERFHKQSFLMGTKIAKQHIADWLSKGDFSSLDDCAGERFIEAFRNTRRLADSIIGSIKYEVKEVKSVDVVNLGLGKRLTCSSPTIGGGSAHTSALAQQSIERTFQVDVRIVSTERFQLWIQDLNPSDGPSEELLRKEMEDWQDVEVVWRFEKALDDPECSWMIIDILGKKT